MFAKRWLSVFLRAYGVLATLAGLSIRPLSTFTGSQDEALDDPIPGYAIDKLFDRFYSLPSSCLLPVRSMPSAKYTALTLTAPASLDLTWMQSK